MGIETILFVDDSQVIRRNLKFVIPSAYKGIFDSARSVEEMKGKGPADLYVIDGLRGQWRVAVDIARKQNTNAGIILVSVDPYCYNDDIEKAKDRIYSSGLRFQDKGDLPQILEKALAAISS